MSKPAEIDLESLKQAQAIMARWFEPEGICAEQAIDELLPVLDNIQLIRAQRELREELGKD
ncbi:TPA: hypothetical protein ACNH47_001650 [Pseudomonas aeruginosa]